MRTYFAIIYDCFRESISSRVLIFVLTMVTIVLLLIAPCGWKTVIPSKLQSFELGDIGSICEMLKASGGDGGRPAALVIWNQLSDNTKERIKSQTTNAGSRQIALREQVTAELNEIISDASFSADDWNGLEISDRAAELRGRQALKLGERELLNRLFIEATFRGKIRPCPTEAVVFVYAFWELVNFPPIELDFARKVVEGFVVAGIGLLVGVLGVSASMQSRTVSATRSCP